MFIIQDYSIAILFCFVTMLCLGILGKYSETGGKDMAL